MATPDSPRDPAFTTPPREPAPSDLASKKPAQKHPTSVERAEKLGTSAEKLDKSRNRLPANTLRSGTRLNTLPARKSQWNRVLNAERGLKDLAQNQAKKADFLPASKAVETLRSSQLREKYSPLQPKEATEASVRESITTPRYEKVPNIYSSEKAVKRPLSGRSAVKRSSRKPLA